jgi:hypothetical protein
MTRQRAINAKCKDCIYDPVDFGTWRQQVEACTSTDCALWEHRPKVTKQAPSTAKPCSFAGCKYKSGHVGEHKL